MRDELIRATAKLASLDYQKRYIVHGTMDSFVLPEELLEDVDGTIYRLKISPQKEELTQEQWTAIEALSRTIDDLSGEALSFGSKSQAFASISEGQAWSTLRAAAADVLAQFGLDVSNLTVEQIDQLSS